MKKWVAGLSFVLATVLVLSACGKSDNANEQSAQPTPSASTPANTDAAAAGAVKEFTLNAKNFEFDTTEIKVSKGDTVKITLKNSQGNHAVKISGYDQEIKNGETISFVADKTGQFDFLCSIMCGAGHTKMTGKLIVE
ncbi:cupredoxin domain-containing protein [Cohnella faecalis]|uniref:Cytochrome C oxidase subunit II n=1 Tax=Cohnella faecalis TaxID=2315694 RepID=A0A398CRJ9_9BACL|nr:cupredoxin domain-containing protein [Cohnella faecalis]RIE05163.1 cytochrome C oxidase subunit II [Cohnella faecalis]